MVKLLAHVYLFFDNRLCRFDQLLPGNIDVTNCAPENWIRPKSANLLYGVAQCFRRDSTPVSTATPHIPEIFDDGNMLAALCQLHRRTFSCRARANYYRIVLFYSHLQVSVFGLSDDGIFARIIHPDDDFSLDIWVHNEFFLWQISVSIRREKTRDSNRGHRENKSLLDNLASG